VGERIALDQQKAGLQGAPNVVKGGKREGRQRHNKKKTAEAQTVVKQEYLSESAEDASSLTTVREGYTLLAQGLIRHRGRERRGEKRALKRTASRMAAMGRLCQGKQGAPGI
jgi:hypothetical protein